MNLKIYQAVQLWEIAVYHPLRYFYAPQAYGEAVYRIPSCDITLVHARRVVWGPVRKWGAKYTDKLEYECVEISHPECYVEIHTVYNTLMYYCKDPLRRESSHPYFKHTYDLDYVGDVSYLKHALIYHDLIQA